MNYRATQKQELIEEIRRRIQHLIGTDAISESEKVTIARDILNLIENGQTDKLEAIQGAGQ